MQESLCSVLLSSVLPVLNTPGDRATAARAATFPSRTSAATRPSREGHLHSCQLQPPFALFLRPSLATLKCAGRSAFCPSAALSPSAWTTPRQLGDTPSRNEQPALLEAPCQKRSFQLPFQEGTGHLTQTGGFSSRLLRVTPRTQQARRQAMTFGPREKPLGK